MIVRRPNLEVVLVPYCASKCVPTAISDGVDISEVSGWDSL